MSESQIPYHIGRQSHVSHPSIHDALRQRLTPPTLTDWQGLHVLFQVEIQILKHQVQFVAIGVYDIQQAHDVGVTHLLEQGDFADGGGGNAFVFGFETDLLEGDDALVGGGEIAGFVDDAVCSCSPKEGL